MSCILYAWRAGEGEQGLRGGAPAQMNFPSAVGLLRDIFKRTHTHTHTPPPPFFLLLFPHFPFTHSTLSTLVLLHHAFHKFHRAAREGPGLWRQVWSEQRHGGGKKKPGRRAFGFLHSCLAAYGAEEGGWQVQCLGTALMSDGGGGAASAQSFTRRLSRWHKWALYTHGSQLWMEER